MDLKLPPLELWLDDAPKTIVDPSYWDKLKELGVSNGSIFIDSSKPKWDRRFSPSQIAKACRYAIDRGMEVTLVTWPLPQKEQIDQMCADMYMLLSLGAVAWEVDLEALWKSFHLDGSFKDMKEAGEYLLKRMRMICEPLDIRIEITTHLGHTESSVHALITPLVHRANMQLYSTRYDWRHREVDWNDSLGPGNRQRFGVERFSFIPCVKSGFPKLGLGLAFYGQKWPYHTEEQALTTALVSALEEAQNRNLVVSCVKGWSSKWVIGHLSTTSTQKMVYEWINNVWCSGKDYVTI